MRANNAGRRAGDAEHPGSVALTHHRDDSVVELVVSGRWDRRTAIDVYDVLRKSLAEHPSAIIIDLHEMNDCDASSAATWIAASQAATMLQPPAQVALCAPPTRQIVTRLRQLGCTRFLSLFGTVDQARAAVASALPLTDRLQLRWLPAHPDTLATVRDVVALACRVWTMPALALDARDVALDLVGDSMAHAGSAMLFTICRRQSSLYLALRDREQTLPPRHPVDARLLVVTTRSFVWGAAPTHDGKVVWAVVR
ncbi:STAS domain-containing protein [Actinoplanes sp. CA-030573]|uniref:STAS domain-containing protein n=1 Tax=Actinoplanes sp. CA-030573 TaxID=3239898 RepID=UPI003D914EF2